MIKSWYLIIVAAVFAILFHSNLNRSVWADFGWAFSQYLETIAILSQFILFNKKVRNYVISGRININIHITFHRSTGNIENIIIDFLGFHIHITKRIQQKQSLKSATRICWHLVHDHANYPSFDHGRFHVLLDQGCQKGRRSPATHLYLITPIVYCTVLFLLIFFCCG